MLSRRSYYFYKLSFYTYLYMQRAHISAPCVLSFFSVRIFFLCYGASYGSALGIAVKEVVAKLAHVEGYERLEVHVLRTSEYVHIHRRIYLPQLCQQVLYLLTL